MARPLEVIKKKRSDGRRKHSEYFSAERRVIPHEIFSPGDSCPCCPHKELRVIEPGSVLVLKGQALVGAEVLSLERLICDGCSKTYTAKQPDDIEAKEATAKAAVVTAHYGYGLPFYRLQSLQAVFGIPLSDYKLWDLARELFPGIKSQLLLSFFLALSVPLRTRFPKPLISEAFPSAGKLHFFLIFCTKYCTFVKSEVAMGLPKVKTSSELRENLSETINEVNEGVEHIISHKSGNVVLISEHSYSKMVNELDNLKQIAFGISEIDSGKGIFHRHAKSTLLALKKKWS